MRAFWLGPVVTCLTTLATSPTAAGSLYESQAPIVWQPAEGYATAPQAPAYAPARPSNPGGLIGLLFGQGQSRYVARYATPQPAASAPYGYRSAAAYPAPLYNAPASNTFATYDGQRTTAAVDPRFLRQEVDFEGGQPAGTIVIDSASKYLYLVVGRGRAIRYGIGVGRPGFQWSGLKTITRKAEWPAWTPPSEMLLRRPDLPTHMEGGPANPLGARAMYLGSSLYRIHGTNEPETIGTNVSSGCIRMMNQDVIDLYDRVKVGTKVVVL